MRRLGRGPNPALQTPREWGPGKSRKTKTNGRRTKSPALCWTAAKDGPPVQFRSRMSECLAQVRIGGRSVLITHRGIVVAILKPVREQRNSLLDKLASAGV